MAFVLAFGAAAAYFVFFSVRGIIIMDDSVILRILLAVWAFLWLLVFVGCAHWLLAYIL